MDSEELSALETDLTAQMAEIARIYERIDEREKIDSVALIRRS